MDGTLRAKITSADLPPPSASLISNLTRKDPVPPLPSLFATAKARLLAADLTNTALIDTGRLSCFPADTTSAQTKEAPLREDVHVQILDVENLALSRWEQIEQLEAIERGETTRGRQVVRVTDDEGDGAAPQAVAKNGTHRLVVQDGKGTRAYAVELGRIKDIAVGTTSIGCKMVLRKGVVAARGTLLLTPQNCVVLGGRIDAWHDAWVKGRMARLKEAVAKSPVIPVE